MDVTLDFVTELAKEAGQILLDGLDDVHTLDYKGPTNIVTEIDKKAEDFIVGRIKQDFPDHTIIAEESGKTQGNQGKNWYIDPVDGTSNYARGLPLFAVSIGFEEAGVMRFGCVYDPVRDESFSANKGEGAWLNNRAIQVSQTSKLIDAMLVTGFPYDIHNENNNLDHFSEIIKQVHVVRRLGSAALDQVYVACGRLDAYWEIGVEAWDIAAGTLIVEEAGGKVTTLKGESEYMVPPYAVLVSNGILHEDLLTFFKKEGK
jgi:myo-inositol-1(or 4)-monophosphatase